MKLAQVHKVTYKQKEILDLIYSHRFLTRIQIQAFLKHKDKKTINLWLKDLRSKDYLNWIYNKDHFVEKTKPAIYYLGINGIRHFSNIDLYPATELRKRYREHERSQTFIDRSLLLADCCLDLADERNGTHYLKTRYYYETDADCRNDRYYGFIKDSELISPDLCFHVAPDEEYVHPDEIESSFLLEIFDASLPRYRLRNRLKGYVQYLDEELDDWEAGTCGDPPPTILLVCANLTDLIYAKRRTRGLIADIWDYDDEDRPQIQFTTTDKLKQRGILAAEIWEQA